MLSVHVNSLSVIYLLLSVCLTIAFVSLFFFFFFFQAEDGIRDWSVTGVQTCALPILPVFTDGSALYTGVITGRGTQQTGFAGRISVNSALVSDPSRFVVYNTSPLTTAGDTTRSDFLYTQLTSGLFTYSPQTGLGSRTSPLTGTLPNYIQ